MARRAVLIVVFALALVRTAHAATVLPPRTVNLTEGEAAAAAEIFAASLNDEGVQGVVEWSLVRLEAQIIVRAQIQGGASEPVQMTAVQLDDLPAVARRVARALSANLPVKETITPDLVTRSETTVPNRTYVERAGGLFVMPVLPLAAGMRIEPAIAFGCEVRLDKGGYFYEIDGGFLLPTGSSDDPSVGGVFSDLGGGVHLGSTSFAPYVGGGLSARILGAFDDGIVGLAPFGQLGITFDRASTAHLYAELRVSQNVIPFTKSDEYSTYSTTESTSRKVYMTEIGARLGLMF